jgi:hypothetical protein
MIAKYGGWIILSLWVGIVPWIPVKLLGPDKFAISCCALYVLLDQVRQAINKDP